ncbi:unnamed protein product [Spirodela intermedia]|uniref:Uncharacterized protein n=1 Tax=Spirodela intermedia TaxID=51605 RepID=A0A7I8K0Z4_SPIIN|nr:unnamed protein product [Spirodela intermedia]
MPGPRRFDPAEDGDGPGEDGDQAEEVRLAPPHAPQVGALVQHVLDDLSPQRRLRPAQPGGHHLAGPVPEVLHLLHRNGLQVVHLGERRPQVEVEHAGGVRAGEAYGQMELPHLLHPGRVQNQQRVRVGVQTVRFERGQPDPDLPNPTVPDTGGGGATAAHRPVEMAVVEDPHRDDGAGIEHLPLVLLVPPGAEGVNDSTGSDPLGAVFGHAVGVGGAPLPLLRLHGHQAGGPQDAHLQHADAGLPQLLRRCPQVAAVHGGLVQDVVPPVEGETELQAAGEPPRPLAVSPFQAEPPGRDDLVAVALLDGGDGNQQATEHLVPAGADAVLHEDGEVVLEGLRHNEDQVLLRVAAGHDCALLPRHQVLCLHHRHPEVPELRGEVDLGLDGGEAVALNPRRRGMPRLGEALVGLRPEPDGQHHLAGGLFPLSVVHPVPLRREGAVRWRAAGDLAHIEGHPPDEILAPLLLLEEDLHRRALNAVAREGEDLVPVEAGGSLGEAAVVPQLDLDVGGQATGNGEAPRLHHPHVQVLHLLDQVAVAAAAAAAAVVAASTAAGASAESAPSRPVAVGAAAAGAAAAGASSRRGDVVAHLAGEDPVDLEAELAADVGEEAALLEREELGNGLFSGGGDAGSGDAQLAEKVAGAGGGARVRDGEDEALVPHGVEILVPDTGALPLVLKLHLHERRRRALPVLGHQVVRRHHLHHQPLLRHDQAGGLSSP